MQARPNSHLVPIDAGKAKLGMSIVPQGISEEHVPAGAGSSVLSELLVPPALTHPFKDAMRSLVPGTTSTFGIGTHSRADGNAREAQHFLKKWSFDNQT